MAGIEISIDDEAEVMRMEGEGVVLVVKDESTVPERPDGETRVVVTVCPECYGKQAHGHGWGRPMIRTDTQTALCANCMGLLVREISDETWRHVPPHVISHEPKPVLFQKGPEDE